MNLFSDIVGNEHIKGYLNQMLRSGKIGNAFLFAGADGIGKSLFAKALAQHLLYRGDVDAEKLQKFERSNHPDFHQYYPEGKIGMHSIDTMRRFKQEVYLPPYEAPWQVFVLHDADRMLPYSSNALLKTFEEPPKHTVIILLSSSPSSLLPTVLSRCRKVFFHLLSEEEIIHLLEKKGIDPEKSRLLAKRAQGSLSRALRLAEKDGDPMMERLLGFLCDPDRPYERIKEVSAYIGEELEAFRTEVEEEATIALGGENLKDFSSAQRESIEKEIQGVVTMHTQAAVESLLQTILGWYRDVQLYHAGGDPHLLLLPLSFEQLPAKGTVLPSISKVYDWIGDARLAVRRFVPVSSALETLFLKL